MFSQKTQYELVSLNELVLNELGHPTQNASPFVGIFSPEATRYVMTVAAKTAALCQRYGGNKWDGYAAGLVFNIAETAWPGNHPKFEGFNLLLATDLLWRAAKSEGSHYEAEQLYNSIILPYYQLGNVSVAELSMEAKCLISAVSLARLSLGYYTFWVENPQELMGVDTAKAVEAMKSQMRLDWARIQFKRERDAAQGLYRQVAEELRSFS